jgi:hypothetical protein
MVIGGTCQATWAGMVGLPPISDLVQPLRAIVEATKMDWFPHSSRLDAILSWLRWAPETRVAIVCHWGLIFNLMNTCHYGCVATVASEPR